MSHEGYQRQPLPYIDHCVAFNGVGTASRQAFEPTHQLSTNDDTGVASFCLICGDKATGKHYGASSCDGCKGFFRRSVRKNHSYACRYNRNCVIDKDKRNQCRYCRLKKCFRVGMKKSAVQNERDKISNRRSSFEENPQTTLLTMQQLIQAEQRVQAIYSRQGQASELFGQRSAELNDVCESMKTQLYLLVEWAKSMPCFVEMSLEDQIALLRAHAGEMLILGVVWRSLTNGREDALILGNNFVISRDSNEPDIADVAGHILDELYNPMRDSQLDESELACLKAIVFFDPHAKGLSDNARRFVLQCRHQVQLDLMNAMNDKQYLSQGRFGELLLILPDLRMITQMMVQRLQLAKTMGFPKIDSLLSETLLASMEQGTSEFPVVPPPTPQAHISPGLSAMIATSMNNSYSSSAPTAVTISNGHSGHTMHPTLSQTNGHGLGHHQFLPLGSMPFPHDSQRLLHQASHLVMPSTFADNASVTCVSPNLSRTGSSAADDSNSLASSGGMMTGQHLSSGTGPGGLHPETHYVNLDAAHDLKPLYIYNLQPNSRSLPSSPQIALLPGAYSTSSNTLSPPVSQMRAIEAERRLRNM